MHKKQSFGGTKKMKVGGSTSKPSATKPAEYKGFRDRIDGGGPGKSGSTFSGGPLAGIGNALGIKPVAPRADKPMGGGGGADSGQAAARVQSQIAAGKAVRDYKGNPDNFGGKGPSAAAAEASAAGAAEASKAAAKPVQLMKRTYQGGPPAGYKHGESPEWNYFKNEMVDAAPKTEEVKPMKKGGAVRGSGCAIRGLRKARNV